MKTVQVSPRSRTLNDLLRQARHNNLILRTADGVEFILAEIDDFDREIELTRNNKKLMALLEKRAKQKKTVSAAEARMRLGIAKD
ncbi:MAG: hypothetical protein HY741_26500 [Chloroflexi bacterium]|nr:hypothetical protein [Chloroflexota bacterium]